MKKIHTSLWIKANAGSGKTTRLTRRVLALLFQGVPPERIVCITYTKAAASEMRERVLKRLQELLILEDEACRAKIADYLEGEVTPAHLARARTLFTEMLDSPHGGLQITTIHGFCQNLLRRFPLEAELAPHFTVLEDKAAEEAQMRAKYAVLHVDSATPELTHALSLLGERGGEWHFDAFADDIISKRRQWGEVVRNLTPEHLRARIYAAHGVEEDTTQEKLAAGCVLTQAQLQNLRAGLPALLSHKTQKYRDWGALLATWLELDAAPQPARLQGLCDTFLREDGTPKAKLFNKTDFPESSPFRVALEELIVRLARYYTQAIALACAEESSAIAVIAHALLTTYEIEKTERQALDYDDLILHTLRLLSHPQTLGWVMAKLDHRIDHLLIDEAQDNSHEQWALAQILVDELMASTEGIGAGGLPRSLLVVGDEKQSIYSFQGAAPQEFASNHTRFAQLLTHSAAPLQAETLAKSYRSAAAVLRFVDTVCALPEVARAIATDGAPEPHLLHHTQAVGRVTLYPPVGKPEKETPPPLTMPLEYRVTRSAAQLLAETIAQTVQQWLADEGRAVRPGDILILVRNRTPMVIPLLRELQKRGVTVAGMDRLTLSTHLAVRDLLALMQWVMTPMDDLALAQVLRSPLVGMGDEELRRIAHPRTGSLWAEVQNPWLVEIMAQKQATPYAFLSFVLEASGKRRAFARRFGNEVAEVLDELLAQAASMPAGMAQTLAMFHEWMTKSTRQIKRELDGEQVDAVRIMTVHGAKGLEAPIVILADTVSVPNTGRERSYFFETEKGAQVPAMGLSALGKASPHIAAAKEAKKQQLIEEYYRLLYVALTRAKYELHLFGMANEKGEVSPASWYAKLREAMRLLVPEGEGALTFADGHEATNTRGEKKVAPTPDRAMPTLPNWAEAPLTLPEEHAQALAPSRLGGEGVRGQHAFASLKTRERGVRIHRILELLPPAHDAALIAAITRHVCPDWEEQEQAAAATQVEALSRQHPWLWAHRRYPEVSIAGTVMQEGRAMPVSGSIDVLLDAGHERIILDYKTSAQVPQSEAEIPPQYMLQLALYRTLLRQIDDRTPIRCAILWTHAPRLMWLGDEA